ncbi:MAG: type VI secretion system protein TssA [Acidobacteriota bacterium]|nr:type VI secretion system protein TssA [Acidobacteriota bacterium]
MLDQLDAYKEEILKPIPGDDPWGEDPKYEDDAEWLKEEIAKMGGMGAGSTDWEQVELKSRGILVQKAKDLNTLAIMVTAWTISHKLPGMVVGMELLAYFLGEPWPDIHPKPMPKKKRARSNSLSWLQEQLGDRLEECLSEDRVVLERGKEAVAQCKDLIYEKFENPPAAFKQIRNRIDEWLLQLPEPVEESEEGEAETDEGATGETAETKAAPARKAEPTTPAPGRPAVQVEAPEVAEDADTGALYAALEQIGRQLHQVDSSQSLPYLLRRMALWNDVSLPRHDDNKETFFPPQDDGSDALSAMLSKGPGQGLLEKAEDLFQEETWWWLDLQFYAAQGAQGANAEEVVDIIERETNRLLERFPELPDLKFNDGKTTFASPQTRDWLQQIAQKAAMGTGGGAAIDPGAELLSAMRQLGSEKFSEALSDAQAAIKGAGDARAAFQMRIAAARFCIEAEQFYWAESLAESLVSQIEHHNLDRWEPELAGRAWAVLLEVARELRETDDAYPGLERRAMKALAGLDLSGAGRYPKSRPVYT